MQHSYSRRRGFTLVELLVVIAIIVVLIAIALPVFSRARESARQRACMANMMQLAQAVRMYRMDMGVYPGPYDPVTGTGGLNDLYPTYLGSRAVFICPDDEMDSGQKYVSQEVTIFRDQDTYDKIPFYDSATNEGLLAYASSLSVYMTDYDPDGNYFVKLWQDQYQTPGYQPAGANGQILYAPQFFSEHYSSYNDLYNYLGNVRQDGFYQMLNFSKPGKLPQYLHFGDNLAYWYAWYLWDYEGVFTAMGQPLRENFDQFNLISSNLQFHLMQQDYCPDYVTDLSAHPDDPTQSALTDALGRRMWDPADASLPYGIPSAAFPGLINNNAPENTVITRCPHHRRYSSVETQKDIALRLDGSCVMLVGPSYDWARQPQQAQ
jgi:prepilin-type N-terminal cleavage/methylation domain-containing protein